MATTSLDTQNGEATTTAAKRASAAAGKENQQQLACPRCDSSNTKFCYYNNYNFSQPRHFCKSCRRYWTHGGALRDIPVGGGSRRNSSSSKRPRTSSSNSSSPTTPLFLGPTTTTNPLFLPTTTATATHAVSPFGSFGSLLSAQGPGPASGFLALGGYGLGLGLEDAACFGFGRGIGAWASFPDHFIDDGSVSGRVLVGSNNGGGHTWQLESGGGLGGGFVGVGGGGVGPDCFPWPDLAISTPGHGLK